MKRTTRKQTCLLEGNEELQSLIVGKFEALTPDAQLVGAKLWPAALRKLGVLERVEASASSEPVEFDEFQRRFRVAFDEFDQWWQDHGFLMVQFGYFDYAG